MIANSLIFALPNGSWSISFLVSAAMTYRLIIALRQFYKRREHVTRNVGEKYGQKHLELIS